MLVKTLRHQALRSHIRCLSSSITASGAQVPYRPRRSLMYVPGNDERKVAKIPVLGADCVCLDCEDGVAINKKEAARENIRRLLDSQSIDFGKGGMWLIIIGPRQRLHFS